MLLLVACLPDNNAALPTRLATAVPISALQPADSGANNLLPPTYTPIGGSSASGQEAWGTLQPGLAGEGGSELFLPTNTPTLLGGTGDEPLTNTPISAAETPIPPGETPLPGSTNTPAPSPTTAVPPSSTPIPIPTSTPIPIPTSTPIPIPTATATQPPPTATPIPPSPSATTAPTNTPIPTGVRPVYRNAVYPIQFIPDVVYGQGLRRNGWNDPGGDVINLTLDIYTPPAEPGLRPALLLYHGGGFQGGSSTFPNMVQTAEHYAARGWVVFVVNYRLGQDFGSVPDDWPEEPGNAVYPAGRDSKAAVRWLHANANQYNVSTNHITAFGGSAGGMLALMLGLSDPSDYRDELTVIEDPTLPSTNLNASAKVHTVVMLWGNDSLVHALETYDGRNRYNAGDSPTIMVHGTEDTTIPFPIAEQVYFALIGAGIPAEFGIITGAGHAAWGAVLDDGRTIYEASFDYIVLQQGLSVIN